MKDDTFIRVERVGIIEQRPTYAMDAGLYAAYQRGRPTVDPPWRDTQARQEHAAALKRCVVQRGTTEVLVDAGGSPPTHALMRRFRTVTTREGTFDVPVGPYWIEALSNTIDCATGEPVRVAGGQMGLGL
jgi:hypothetical protein